MREAGIEGASRPGVGKVLEEFSTMEPLGVEERPGGLALISVARKKDECAG